MTDILDTIDAATNGLCACGCQRPLDPGGPSAWWATEACQRAWQGGVRQLSVVTSVDFASLTATLARVAVAYARFVHSLAEACGHMECPPEPPRRNVGPTIQQRPPRRIDPHRARR